MAIAHICLNCAKDLARQPALFDPIYSLPLVICPDCNKASVRIPNNHSVQYKRVLRGVSVFFTLLIQAIFIVALTAATIALIQLLDEIVSDVKQNGLLMRTRLNVIAAFAITSIVTGAWLTVGLSRTPKYKAWLGWSTFIVIVYAFTYAINLYVHPFTPTNTSDIVFEEVFKTLLAMGLLMAIMMFAVTGIPIGKFVQYLHRIIVHERWRWRKRRLQLRRA